jgi:hypothetical protein
MYTATCKDLYSESWKDLYDAAFHETDLSTLPERITNAELAIAMRMRELLYESGDKFEEEESLDDAICALYALRRSLKRRSTTFQGRMILFS